jgi:hypothetical protein
MSIHAFSSYAVLEFGEISRCGHKDKVSKLVDLPLQVPLSFDVHFNLFGNSLRGDTWLGIPESLESEVLV